MDAAIAGLLCVGLFNAHSAGIGGGSFIMYYDRETETPSFLNSREVAPLLASTDMYTNESSDASTVGKILGSKVFPAQKNFSLFCVTLCPNLLFSFQQ